MKDIVAVNYTLGFKEYLEGRFQNNDLGIAPVGEDYSQGFRGKHKPFDLEFEANFSDPLKRTKSHRLDFYFELDFPKDRILALQLRTEIGKGKQRDEGKLSKILTGVKRSYENAGRKGRDLYRADAKIRSIPKDQRTLYGEIWASIIRRQFIAATGQGARVS